MKPYLVFRMYGPMASWGDVAVGEYRPTSLQPSKSAILGLVASALGIPRENESVHTALSSDLGCAMYLDSPGVLLRDYHTIQVPSGRKGARYATRRDELSARDKEGARDLNTILSTRDYWCDSAYTLCIWSRKRESGYSLESIQDALRRPRYPLFLGRRSCPLALPLNPEIKMAESFHAAYLNQDVRSLEFLTGMEFPTSIAVYWDEDGTAGFPSSQGTIYSTTRRDEVRSRTLPQYDERRELHAVVNLGAKK